MTTDGETFVDTNVLLAATAHGRPFHAAALRALNAGFATRSLRISGQVIREYLSVATRPVAANGLGLSQEAALANAREFHARAVWLDEDAAVLDTLLALMGEVTCLGKQVHDTNIVATMLTHGVVRLLTLNPKDFARFGDRIEVVTLDAVRA